MSPSLIEVGRNYQSFVGFSEGTSTPLGTNTDCEYSAMTFRGRWIPSNIWSRMPGPSSTDSGCLVLSTGSPTVKPAESPYTYMCLRSTGCRLSHRPTWWSLRLICRSQPSPARTSWIRPFFRRRRLHRVRFTRSWHFEDLSVRTLLLAKLLNVGLLLHCRQI